MLLLFLPIHDNPRCSTLDCQKPLVAENLSIMGICGSAAPNCTLYKLGQDPWVFEADPDTAGIGVRFLESIVVRTPWVSHILVKHRQAGPNCLRGDFRRCTLPFACPHSDYITRSQRRILD